MPGESSTTRSAGDDVLAGAADRLRDAAKWMVVSFGAAAAVVFAGLTVADLGDLDFSTPNYRFTIALIGGAVAIVGVVAAMATAMRLAGASTTSLHDLARAPRRWELALKRTRQEIADDPALQAWDTDGSSDLTARMKAFLSDYADAYGEFYAEVEKYAGDTNPAPDTRSLKKAARRLDYLSATSNRLLRTVGFLRLQASFTYARFVIAGWLLFATAGAIGFGWAVSDPADDGPTLATRPVLGQLAPSVATVADINRQLPAECEVDGDDEVAVIAVAEADDDMVDAVTVPADEDCPPTAITVPSAHITAP